MQVRGDLGGAGNHGPTESGCLTLAITPPWSAYLLGNTLAVSSC